MITSSSIGSVSAPPQIMSVPCTVILRSIRVPWDGGNVSASDDDSHHLQPPCQHLMTTLTTCNHRASI
eukprot:6593261-Pyramimonas_sp.AAC.1